MPFDPVEIVRTLNACGVRYVAIGMFAAVVQGAVHDTEDIDVSYEAGVENRRRLATALNALDVRFRIEGDPAGAEVPGGVDERTLTGVTSLAFTTPYGNLDVVLLPDGTRGYDDLIRDAHDEVIADDVTIKVASIRDIIRSKEAAGREKDRAVLPALRRLAEYPRHAD